MRYFQRIPVLLVVSLLASCGYLSPIERTTDTPANHAATGQANDAASATPAATKVEGCRTGTTLNDWTVELRLTGGFAGLNRALSVSSDGRYTASDIGLGQEVSGVLAANDLEAIRSVLVGACPMSVADRPPACADCFEYSIIGEWDGERFEALANDASLPESRLAPLVETLSSQLERALAGSLGGG